jgi:hypothetical protein
MLSDDCTNILFRFTCNCELLLTLNKNKLSSNQDGHKNLTSSQYLLVWMLQCIMTLNFKIKTTT